MAEKVSAEANELDCPRERQAQRNQAAAIALFFAMPVQLADTRLVFGETLSWNGATYVIDTRLSVLDGSGLSQRDR